MKRAKKIHFWAAAAALAVLLAGCGQYGLPPSGGQGASQAQPAAQAPTSSRQGGEDVIEIGEKLFVARTNDIYFNPEDYMGKTIKYEGIFDIYEVPETGEKHYFVIRYGPGCCGVDSNPGFEVRWNGDCPQQNDWVEAAGVLEVYEEGGYAYLRLALDSLAVLPVRGAEYVAQ